MVSYFDCGEELRQKGDGLASAITAMLAENAVGIYLHGSLAMGCCNPQQSDIDLLTVTRGAIAPARRREIIARLLAISASGFPVEISFVEAAVLAAAEYPLRYELHYSEAWRQWYTEHLSDAEWEIWHSRRLTDPDLAAHIRVIKSRGVRLSGKDISMVFPDVSDAEYTKAIQGDLADAAQGIADRPVYYILNLCRFYGFLLTGAVLSKREAGLLVRECLGKDAAAAVDKALRGYAGAGPVPRFAAGELECVRAELETGIKEYLSG